MAAAAAGPGISGFGLSPADLLQLTLSAAAAAAGSGVTREKVHLPESSSSTSAGLFTLPSSEPSKLNDTKAALAAAAVVLGTAASGSSTDDDSVYVNPTPLNSTTHINQGRTTEASSHSSSLDCRHFDKSAERIFGQCSATLASLSSTIGVLNPVGTNCDQTSANITDTHAIFGSSERESSDISSASKGRDGVSIHRQHVHNTNQTFSANAAGFLHKSSWQKQQSLPSHQSSDNLTSEGRHHSQGRQGQYSSPPLQSPSSFNEREERNAESDRANSSAGASGGGEDGGRLPEQAADPAAEAAGRVRASHDAPNPFESFYCPLCEFSTRRFPGLLLRHMFGHIGVLPFECWKCNERFRLPERLVDHFVAEHSVTGGVSGTALCCTACRDNKPFRSRRALVIHQLQFAVERTQFCYFCAKGFSAVGAMSGERRRHLRSAHKFIQQLEKHKEAEKIQKQCFAGLMSLSCSAEASTSRGDGPDGTPATIAVVNGGSTIGFPSERVADLSASAEINGTSSTEPHGASPNVSPTDITHTAVAPASSEAALASAPSGTMVVNATPGHSGVEETERSSEQLDGERVADNLPISSRRRLQRLRCPECERAFPNEDALRIHSVFHLDTLADRFNPPLPYGTAIIGARARRFLFRRRLQGSGARTTFIGSSGVQPNSLSGTSPAMSPSSLSDTKSRPAVAFRVQRRRLRAKNFPCDHCEKVFVNRLTRAWHARLHRRSFVCRVCPRRRSFTTLCAFLSHAAEHDEIAVIEENYLRALNSQTGIPQQMAHCIVANRLAHQQQQQTYHQLGAGIGGARNGGASLALGGLAAAAAAAAAAAKKGTTAGASSNASGTDGGTITALSGMAPIGSLQPVQATGANIASAAVNSLSAASSLGKASMTSDIGSVPLSLDGVVGGPAVAGTATGVTSGFGATTPGCRTSGGEAGTLSGTMAQPAAAASIADGVPVTGENNLTGTSAAVANGAVGGSVERHECPTCSKVFGSANSLRAHKKSHTTGKTPHKCPTCGKQFVRSYDMKRHMRTHDSSAPFICQICGQKFSQSSSLKKHYKTHRIHCPLCLKQFDLPEQLTSHVALCPATAAGAAVPTQQPQQQQQLSAQQSQQQQPHQQQHAAQQSLLAAAISNMSTNMAGPLAAAMAANLNGVVPAEALAGLMHAAQGMMAAAGASGSGVAATNGSSSGGGSSAIQPAGTCDIAGGSTVGSTTGPTVVADPPSAVMGLSTTSAVSTPVQLPADGNDVGKTPLSVSTGHN